MSHDPIMGGGGVRARACGPAPSAFPPKKKIKNIINNNKSIHHAQPDSPK